MEKLNCWEFKQCGRECEDCFFEEVNTCPTSIELCTDGINGGENGGRACWAIAGTCSGNEIKCNHAEKLNSCRECDFYKLVQREEADKFITGSELTEMIQYKEEILMNARQL
jgi:hypothetical protein